MLRIKYGAADFPGCPVFLLITKSSAITVRIHSQENLNLPEEFLRQSEFTLESLVRLERTDQGWLVSSSPHHLARIYVEPTNACNLGCRTCMRNVWEEPLGRMSRETFDRILEGISSFTPRPLVFFGGFGEPLAHPDIRKMVTRVRQSGADVELITNCTLLNEDVFAWMIAAGLNRVWVSIDGATSASYADVRLGDELPGIISSLERLKYLREGQGLMTPSLGIAFVAMKRNIADLPEVLKLGMRLGADRFSISNLLPHTPELRDEILYARAMYEPRFQPSRWSPRVDLPRIDYDKSTLRSLAAALSNTPADAPGFNRCPFVAKRSVSVRWDGSVSPCLPLLHTHTAYLGENLRTSRAYAAGRLSEQSLSEIWNRREYTALRERLFDFDFSLCTFSNSCEMAESNREDCFGNSEPACGGCLWVQGFIQCP